MSRAKNFLVSVVAAAIATLMAGGCYADNNKGKIAELKIGDAAPVWSDLPGTDDQKHGLADYKDAKLLVVVFTCNHCPVARAYRGPADRLGAGVSAQGGRRRGRQCEHHRARPPGGDEEAGDGQGF